MRSIALRPTVAAIVMAIASYSAASAAPYVFTLNPSATTPALSGTGPVQGNTLIVADYAIIHMLSNGPGNNNFTETGFLSVASVQLNGVTSPTPVGQVGGYGVYLAFTASGYDVGPLPTSMTYGSPQHDTDGTITSITYTLYGVPGGPPTFTVNTPGGTVVVGNNAGQIVLAADGAGALPGTVVATLTTQGLTTAADSFVQYVPLQPGFITIPHGSAMYAEAAFTNPAYTVSIAPDGSGGSYIGIDGGGGSMVLVVTPEPASLLVLGAGLLGLFGIRFRRT